MIIEKGYFAKTKDRVSDNLKDDEKIVKTFETSFFLFWNQNRDNRYVPSLCAFLFYIAVIVVLFVFADFAKAQIGYILLMGVLFFTIATIFFVLFAKQFRQALVAKKIKYHLTDKAICISIGKDEVFKSKISLDEITKLAYSKGKIVCVQQNKPFIIKGIKQAAMFFNLLVERVKDNKTKIEFNQKYIICNYCGTKYAKELINCPKCGSGEQNNRRG